MGFKSIKVASYDCSSFQLIRELKSNFKKPMNIGNPAEFTIKELAFLIKNLVNPKLEIIYKELPQDDPKQRKPSIKLAKEILNWEPAIPLKDGLIKTIEWFRKNL